MWEFSNINIMENLCNFSQGNLTLVLGDETVEKAKNNCIELLKYRVKHHVEEVKENYGDEKTWRLVLRDSIKKEEHSLNVSNYETILCSGYGDVPEDFCKKQKDIFDRFSEDLVLVKLQEETNGDVCYVLSDHGEKDKVIGATSEVECHGRILYISKGQDPPEAISCEVIKSYFGNNKKSCSNLDKRRIQMIMNGDVQKLKKEVFDAVDIKHSIDRNGWTMLHHAVYHGNLEIVSLLTSIGFDVHAQDSICGRKPLIIAAREGHTNIIEFFQLQGLRINEADSIGWTLLHYAAWKGNLEAVRFLIEKKAPINVKDKCSGKIPVHVATEEGHLEVVKLLVSSGSSIEEETNERKTPLCLAALKGFLHITEFLVDSGANLNAVDSDGWTPFLRAASKGHMDIVEFLADKGGNIEAEDSDCRTLLHRVASEGHMDIIEFLADIEAEDSDGRTPLHRVASEGHMGIVEFLVDRGADIEAEDSDSRTLLHRVASEGHLSIVEYLVDRGADIEAEDFDGQAPLHLAVSEGRMGIMKFLVDRGANIEAGDSDGRTPLHHAANKGHFNIVKFLVDRGANIKAGDTDGRTPLYLAVNKGYLNIVEFLVGRGADLHVGDENDWTPLHRAASEGHLSIVEFLVDRGADLNAVDKEGKTPLLSGMMHVVVVSYLAKRMLNLLQNRGKMAFYKELLEHQKNNLGTVHPKTLTTQRKIGEILYDQCEYSAALDILNAVPRSKRDTSDFIILRYKCELQLMIIETETKMKNEEATENLKDILQETYLGVASHQESLIPEEMEMVEIIKDNFCVNEAENNNTFKLTKAANFKKEFEYKPFLLFKYGKGIHVCMICYWLMLSIICCYAISCFQHK